MGKNIIECSKCGTKVEGELDGWLWLCSDMKYHTFIPCDECRKDNSYVELRVKVTEMALAREKYNNKEA